MSKSSSAQPCDLVVFGTKGDLARRKLWPALYQLFQSELLGDPFKMIGVARDQMTTESYRASIKENLEIFLQEPLEAAVWEKMCARIHYVAIDLLKAEDYKNLLTLVNPRHHITISYFATPPSLYGTISQGLHEIGLTQAPARVVLEKPIGHD